MCVVYYTVFTMSGGYVFLHCRDEMSVIASGGNECAFQCDIA